MSANLQSNLAAALSAQEAARAAAAAYRVETPLVAAARDVEQHRLDGVTFTATKAVEAVREAIDATVPRAGYEREWAAMPRTEQTLYGSEGQYVGRRIGGMPCPEHVPAASRVPCA